MRKPERDSCAKQAASTPASPIASRESAAPLPIVRVPKGKRASAKASLRVTVLCESPSRPGSAQLLTLLHEACDAAGILHQDTLEATEPAPQSLLLAIVDAGPQAAMPDGCVLVCDAATDEVLRSAFAHAALGIITRETLRNPSHLTQALRAARDLQARRASLRTQGDATRAERRAARLLRAARSIAASRDALAEQLAMVCEQLSQSCMDVSAQLHHVAMSSELQTLLRQDLDIESVLRTSLEFMLRKLGPTNAAIYLPSTTGDYTLGAYINYDCPRDGIEQTLDHLGDAIVPTYGDRPGLHVLAACEHDLPTITSTWVQDSSMLVYSAHADDECTAVIAVFRDSQTSFDAEARKLVGTTGSLLGAQLARIVKTHQRWKAA